MQPKTFPRYSVRVVQIAVSVLALVSCNGGQADHRPKLHVIDINNMQFAPTELTLHKGDAVEWISNDIAALNATQIGSAWESPKLSLDDSWEKVIPVVAASM